jgi:hypothetical protein
MCAWNVEYGPLACLCVMRACAEDVDFLKLFVHEPCRLYLAIGLLVAVFAGSFQSRVLVHV